MSTAKPNRRRAPTRTGRTTIDTTGGTPANDDGRGDPRETQRQTRLTEMFTLILSAQGAQWTTNWRGLWHGYDSCPQAFAREALADHAIRWLGERVHGTGWTRVWSSVMAHAELRSDTATRVTLMRIALRWLPENRSHAEWSLVRSKVIEHCAELPPEELTPPALTAMRPPIQAHRPLHRARAAA